MVPKLEPKSLESLSDIEVSFSLGEHPCESYPRTLLVIACCGTYGIGSGGNSDATYLMAMGKAGLEAFEPHGVILDLRELAYKWGDMLEAFFGIGGEKPLALVVGEKCRTAIGTLCFGENSITDACQENWIFDSLNDAWSYVTKLLDEGDTPPLHAAAKVGDHYHIASLISHGADPNREDSQGNRPLHEASDEQTARILIAAGADVRAKNRHGVTALHLAKDARLARILIEAGADPDARSQFGGSPLNGVSNPEVARVLLDAGADIDLRARSTLLHHVRNPDVARIFLDFGARVNVIDENGKTPLDVTLRNQEIFAEQARRAWGSKTDKDTARSYQCIADMLRQRGGMTAEELRSKHKI